ncbi:DUF4174 domain-containing protein [Dyadobacter psychrotolerans]|uniref:DUF4174 domain-containing protein n=1 Tax=Dyadobacter psychrotolerans TaxID=2541721 RepID=A0A4R5DW84_9BACT|nr:DUF4174 domain-containing protein [Dyadobacter psychrotolerans]TDE16864.1 DUF4174 domain-containing protein [Dyadobacter psychrotolerans]
MKLLILLFLFMSVDQPRKVLLFYKEDGKVLYDRQIADLQKQKGGLAERDIEISSFPYSAQTASVWAKNKIDKDSAFTFILIGRDGGEKYRSVMLVTAVTLFGQIDAMPMRRSEVRRK